jgi:hypothetical protein
MLVCDGLFKKFGIVCFRHVNRNFGIKERSLNQETNLTTVLE